MNFTQAFLLAIADLIIDTGNILDAAEVKLFQNDITPTPETLIGDFVAADYSGYAAEVVTWLAPTVSDANQVEVQGIVGEFRPNASTVTNNIFGWYLTTTGGVLLGSGRFEGAPLSMNGVLSNIIVTPRIRPTGSGEVAVIS